MPAYHLTVATPDIYDTANPSLHVTSFYIFFQLPSFSACMPATTVPLIGSISTDIHFDEPTLAPL